MVHQMIPVQICYKLYACLILTTLLFGMSLLAILSFIVLKLGGIEVGCTFMSTILYCLMRWLIPKQQQERSTSSSTSSYSSPWSCCGEEEFKVLTMKELEIHTSLYKKKNEENHNNVVYDDHDDNITSLSSSSFTTTTPCCSICLESYSEGDLLSEIRSCQHTFHHDCLDQWIHRSRSCPYCRRGIEKKHPLVVDDNKVGIFLDGISKIKGCMGNVW